MRDNIRSFTLDGRKIQGREQAHSYIKEVLGLADYYVSNLDALHDMLGEMYPVSITIEHADVMEGREYASKLLNMLRTLDRSEEEFELREINDRIEDDDFSEVSD